MRKAWLQPAVRMLFLACGLSLVASTGAFAQGDTGTAGGGGSTDNNCAKNPLPVNNCLWPGEIKLSKRLAYQMARNPWLDIAAKADPPIIEAICKHPGPAKLVAKHEHIAQIAEADPYLCRRLTQWEGSTWALVRNSNADKVIVKDPQGIYFAIDRDPNVARVLSSHIAFWDMMVGNPDLGRVMANHMR